jgi:hypothetical protein
MVSTASRSSAPDEEPGRVALAYRINLWLGWSKMNPSDFYAGGLRDDETRHREWCDKAGLGLSFIGLHGPQKEVQIDSATVT